MHHQKHISNLLQSSTLLASAPPSPYTQALTLANPQPLTNTRRGVLARAANSPFGGRGYAAASGSGETVKDKDTPSKKKKSRVAQLGVKDDDEVSIAGKKPTKKRKPYVTLIVPRFLADLVARIEQYPPPTRSRPHLHSLANPLSHVPLVNSLPLPIEPPERLKITQIATTMPILMAETHLPMTRTD